MTNARRNLYFRLANDIRCFVDFVLASKDHPLETARLCYELVEHAYHLERLAEGRTYGRQLDKDKSLESKNLTAIMSSYAIELSELKLHDAFNALVSKEQHLLISIDQDKAFRWSNVAFDRYLYLLVSAIFLSTSSVLLVNQSLSLWIYSISGLLLGSIILYIVWQQKI